MARHSSGWLTRRRPWPTRSRPCPRARSLRPPCFHAQQAAEKALKAALIHHGLGFPRTHNIAALLDALAQIGPVPDRLTPATTLTHFATFLRHPAEGVVVTQAMYQEALRLAEAVVAWAEEVISKEVSGDA